jgi:hypothetical protein
MVRSQVKLLINVIFLKKLSTYEFFFKKSLKMDQNYNVICDIKLPFIYKVPYEYFFK